MIRSAMGKVAWMARATTTVVGLAIMLALVFGVATTAMGANGQNLLLGSLTNAATTVTGLVGNVDGAALRVTNPNAGTNDTALDLRVQAGEAPMRVNSAKKVANLNADRIDDREANSFANGVGGKATNADKLDGLNSSHFAQANTEGSALSAVTAGNADKIDNLDSTQLAGFGETEYKADEPVMTCSEEVLLTKTFSVPRETLIYASAIMSYDKNGANTSGAQAFLELRNAANTTTLASAGMVDGNVSDTVPEIPFPVQGVLRTGDWPYDPSAVPFVATPGNNYILRIRAVMSGACGTGAGEAYFYNLALSYQLIGKG